MTDVMRVRRQTKRFMPCMPMARRVIPCGRGARLVWRGRPLVMGVLNVTPDSFSDGGTFHDPREALRRGIAMATEGADLIDVGGESTRPGARPVPLRQELRRTIPVIERLVTSIRIPVSIDTMKAEVAREATRAGASIINDVSSLAADPGMAGVAAASRSAVILMHMAGSPRTMQRRPRYRDAVTEIAAYLSRQAMRAGRAGIDPDRILIDPGLGFGKTVRHNLELMRGLSVFAALGYPVVVGPSRKSFLGKTLGVGVADRLAGTLACVSAAMEQGAHIVRVHDVLSTVQFIRMHDAIGGTSQVKRVVQGGNGHGPARR